VLGCVGDGLCGFGGEVFDGTLALSEEFEELEAASAGKGFADAGELFEEGVFEVAFFGGVHIQLFKHLIE